jgi:hypothetical protein
MESRALWGVGLLAVAIASSTFAQSRAAITLDQVMTGEELRKTGVEGLTPAQRSALDQWLSDYTLQVIEFAKGSSKPGNSTPGSYAGRQWGPDQIESK